MNWIKRYWAEILVFGAIFVIFMVDLNPDYTFMMKAADSVGYLYSAKFLYPSYHTSPPLYLLVSHLFLQIPFGTDAWRMGLVSVLSSMGACVFIYLTIKSLIIEHWLKQKVNGYIHHADTLKMLKGARLYALLGVLIYGTSALVISQTIVVQTYATVCLLATGAFYFAQQKRWKLVGVMLGMGLAVHLLMGFVWLIMMGFKQYRYNWWALLITFSFLAFYIYIPLTNRPPYMWFPDPNQVNSVWAFVMDTLSTINFVIGSLAIWDLPKRILDTIGLVGISIGVVTIVPIIYYFRHNKVWTNPLFWLSMFPIILFITELDMNTYDYVMVGIPFLAIVACLGLNEMVEKYFNIRLHRRTTRLVVAKMAGVGWLVALTWVAIISFGIFNFNYLDIGRTVDPNLSAARLYYQEFNKIPENAIFMPNYAMEWEAIYKYNADYGKHIYPICIYILPSPVYQEQLHKDGINFQVGENEDSTTMMRDISQSIIALNDNVWTTVSTIPETLQTDVVPANHNVNLVDVMTDAQVHEIADNPKILWKPYNPYDVLTNSILQKEWRNQLLSTWNVRLFACLGLGAWFIMWLLEKWQKKKEGAIGEQTEFN